MCAATTLLLLVGVAVGREPPLAQQWFSQNSISLVDRAQAGPPARNQRRFAEAIMNNLLYNYDLIRAGRARHHVGFLFEIYIHRTRHRLDLFI